MKHLLRTLLLLLCLTAHANVDTHIILTNWNSDVVIKPERAIFVSPRVFSNNLPVSLTDITRYVWGANGDFYISNQISGYYMFEIQAPPASRRLYLSVPAGSGSWTPGLTDWTFGEVVNFSAGYTRDQTDARIHNATNGLSGGSSGAGGLTNGSSATLNRLSVTNGAAFSGVTNLQADVYYDGTSPGAQRMFSARDSFGGKLIELNPRATAHSNYWTLFIGDASTNGIGANISDMFMFQSAVGYHAVQFGDQTNSFWFIGARSSRNYWEAYGGDLSGVGDAYELFDSDGNIFLNGSHITNQFAALAKFNANQFVATSAGIRIKDTPLLTNVVSRTTLSTDGQLTVGIDTYQSGEVTPGSGGLTVNGDLTADSFNGPLVGNAATATTASSVASGVTNQWRRDITNTVQQATNTLNAGALAGALPAISGAALTSLPLQTNANHALLSGNETFTGGVTFGATTNTTSLDAARINGNGTAPTVTCNTNASNGLNSGSTAVLSYGTVLAGVVTCTTSGNTPAAGAVWFTNTYPAFASTPTASVWMIGPTWQADGILRPLVVEDLTTTIFSVRLLGQAPAGNHSYKIGYLVIGK